VPFYRWRDFPENSHLVDMVLSNVRSALSKSDYGTFDYGRMRSKLEIYLYNTGVLKFKKRLNQ
jgi:hypothetical protein